jgi:acylphosphatase
MGLLSDIRKMIEGQGAANELEQMELEQVRKMAAAAERGEATMDDTVLGPKVRRRYRFVGSVQGVGFRWTTTNLASSVGATGWVMNERDGSVTAEIQGIREQVQAVIDGLERYYNGRRWMAGFRIEEARDVDVIEGEYDFRPLY